MRDPPANDGLRRVPGQVRTNTQTMYTDEESQTHDLRNALLLAALIVAVIVALLGAVWVAAMNRDEQITMIEQAAHARIPLRESDALLEQLSRDSRRIGAEVLPGTYTWRTAGATRTVSHELRLEADGRFSTKLVTSANGGSDVTAMASGIWHRIGATLKFNTGEGNTALFGQSGRMRLVEANQDSLALVDEVGLREFDWVPVPRVQVIEARPAADESPEQAEALQRALLLLLALVLMLVLVSGGDSRSSHRDEVDSR